MAERKRVIVLVIIMAVIALAIGGMSISVLYKTAFEEERTRLIEAAQSQARLMEAVARFDQQFSQQAHPQGAAAATISQIVDAHKHYRGFGETGEFTLARREGDQIVFLLSHRHHDLDKPHPVAFDGVEAEPMRRALSGRSGAVTGLDYRGVTVLAAHEPVAELNLGIVAKIDMAEIRAPFMQAGGAVAVLSLALIAAGALLFFRISNPMIEALRESEKKHRSLFETMAQGVVYQDVSGRIASANPAAETLLGLSLDQMQGRTSVDPRWKAVHEDGSEFPGETHPGPIAQKTGEKVLGVVMGVFNPKEGDYRWINIDAIPQFRNGEDKPYQTFATFSDFTERRQAEKALAEAEIRWRSVAEQSPDHIILLDRNLDIEFISSTLPGFTKEQVIGTSALSYFPVDIQEERAELLRHVLDSNEPASYETTYTIPDGSQRFIESRVASRIVDNTPAGLTIHARDITDRKHAEEVLREAKEEAETANRAKSDFLSRMSHELRTPLHGVLGFAQILNMDTNPSLSDRQLTATDHILKSGEHLLALIDDVLDLARIDSGKLVLSIETVAPAAVLSECLEMIRGLAGSHGVVLEDRVSGKSLPPIRADMTRFHQVLINLLSNAIKYNHEGGCVSVDCEPTAEDMLRVSVADTGGGIPEDMQQRLFEPFQRLGKEVSEVEGTGIGLTVAKELMEMMNGGIGFESTVGTGSTFWVDFPLAGETELKEEVTVRGFAVDDDAIETPREPVLAGGPDGHTVLYVEDNPHNLQLMKAIIGEMPGIHLISACSAELGVEMAEKDAPDLILMDINLPGMSGAEAVHLLKANAKTRDIPVIAVTAAAMSHDVEKGKKDGFSGYLVKPFKVYDLLKTIAETLEGRD